MSATRSKPEPTGRLDPYLDPFTDTGASIRERQGTIAARLRREGHTFAEIARVLHISDDLARALVRSRDRKLMLDSKTWTAARRARILAQLEREDCGPLTYMARFKGVAEAQRAGDVNGLIGALHDHAASAISWAQWLREHRSVVES